MQLRFILLIIIILSLASAGLFYWTAKPNLNQAENSPVTTTTNQPLVEPLFANSNLSNEPNTNHQASTTVPVTENAASTQSYAPTKTVKAIHLDAIKMGGWDLWLAAFKRGEIDISHLSEDEKGDLFVRIISDGPPDWIHELVQLGFTIPERAFYGVILAGADLQQQEMKILQQFDILASYTAIEDSNLMFNLGSFTFNAGPYDRAIGFGYLKVMQRLDAFGIKPLSSNQEIYEGLLRGRQPSIAIVQHLTKLGYPPPKNVMTLAEKSKIAERNPELFEYLKKYQ
ncbi:hypothetical protein ACO1PK_12905 [Alishewanella sp. d11]|uniref:hypothetical protein n=1 Tax=Alishewanella sp. d11 TaxID=3414030 RepID=UPI003BF8D880